ncbi:hypothetical protein H1R13_07280 [Streptomyces mexicanus]|uniref:Uncharacterized protein n=1 Tax=Streptomyces mexicanus TaxID=178566 RepID=A0A7X1LPF3_9ACTN|nr:hypothetical protein [Streptomyces mexicanus]MBC2864803.1 hypothetical protein [Streptomyces mexicanus]
MTTRSSPPQPDPSVLAFTEEIHRAGPPGGVAAVGDGVSEGEGEAADGDPARGPAQAAVGERLLEEVVRLVTLLEKSPECADAAGSLLRAAALDRPVEDVARLVAELPRPPRPADSADATIRAAVRHRCIEDVTRLVAMLHRAPQRPHCGREAVRAAAGTRTPEELVELIAGLVREQVPARLPAAEAEPVEPGEEPMGGRRTAPGDPDAREAADAADAAGPSATADGHRDRDHGRLLFWPSWLAAAALVVCGAAHFPLHRQGAPLLVYGLALAVSVLCAVLALLLAVRPGVAVLVASAVGPGLLAALGYVEGRFASAGLSRALSVTVAPPAGAGLTAACASLASLAALSLLLMVQVAERHPAPRPTD